MNTGKKQLKIKLHLNDNSIMSIQVYKHEQLKIKLHLNDNSINDVAYKYISIDKHRWRETERESRADLGGANARGLKTVPTNSVNIASTPLGMLGCTTPGHSSADWERGKKGPAAS